MAKIVSACASICRGVAWMAPSPLQLPADALLPLLIDAGVLPTAHPRAVTPSALHRSLAALVRDSQASCDALDVKPGAPLII